MLRFCTFALLISYFSMFIVKRQCTTENSLYINFLGSEPSSDSDPDMNEAKGKVCSEPLSLTGSDDLMPDVQPLRHRCVIHLCQSRGMDADQSFRDSFTGQQISPGKR